MHLFRSLTAKYFLVSLVILSIISVFIYASVRFTRHMSGEAATINAAGQLRFRSYQMAWHAQRYAEEAFPPEARTQSQADLGEQMQKYDKLIEELMLGSIERNTKPITHYQEVLQLFEKIRGEWERELRPLLGKIAALPIDAPEKKVRALLENYDKRLPGFVDDVNDFVKALELHYDGEIRRFVQQRLFILMGFACAAIFSARYIRNNIVAPMNLLARAASRLQDGDFDVQAPSRSSDEIGTLGVVFNGMAANLKALFAERSRKLQESEALNTISHAAGESLTVEVMAGKIMDAVMNLEPLALEKKGAIFINDRDKNTLKLVVSRNFSDEQVAGCGTVPYGECLCGIAAGQERAVLSESNVHDARHTKIYAGAKEHGHIILPLKSRDRMIGILCLYLAQGRSLSDDEHRLFESIADIIAVALQNAINHRQVAMLAQSLDSSNDVIVIADTEGRITHVNPEAIRELGYSLTELIGQPASLIQSTANPPGLGAEIFRNTLKGGWFGELLNRRKDGSEYPVLLTTSLVRDVDGQVIALVGIARDITVLKKAEERLKEYAETLELRVDERTRELEDANRELQVINRELDLRKQEAEESKAQAESANKAKSEFLANMSHELRTPLNAIIGFSDIMINGQTGPLTGEQLDFMGDIGKSGRHLLALINDILDLSKVEAGKMELELGAVGVRELIERSLVMFKEKAMKHRINVECRVADGITDILADEMKLKQVLVNLLSNAFKFTPDGGAVQVTARRVRSSAFGVQREEDAERIAPMNAERDADLIEISVTDTGPGIKAEDIPKLFRPFQQLDTTMTRRVSGTGLGLNLCKRFIDLHGGTIGVESEAGKGSRFVLTIPIRQGRG